MVMSALGVTTEWVPPAPGVTPGAKQLTLL